MDFFYGKWLCWDVGPALFSEVTLFHLSEVFCGSQICQNVDPAAGRAKIFRATTNKVVNFFQEKVHPARSFCTHPHPQCKMLATRLGGSVRQDGQCKRLLDELSELCELVLSSVSMSVAELTADRLAYQCYKYRVLMMKANATSNLGCVKLLSKRYNSAICCSKMSKKMDVLLQQIAESYLLSQ